MSDKMKRFYKVVETKVLNGQFIIELDKRAIKTPAGSVLSLPDKNYAEEVAGEWRQQAEFIDRSTMPYTRFAEFVLDVVNNDPESARQEILQYAHSDSICYRAEGPESLVQRQTAAWDPVLTWFADKLGITFLTTRGIRYIEQGANDMKRIEEHIAAFEGYELGAVQFITRLTGSALLALYLQQRRLGAEEVWSYSHVDEDFQAEHWGEDMEALQRRQAQSKDFSVAASILVKNVE